MGWLPSIFGGGNNEPSSSDPLGKLNPQLREFLERESPVKYTTKQEEASAASAPARDGQDSAAADTGKAAVPSKSLYQDGRYAHLWKNYKSLEQIESDSSTDHDKMLRVLDGFKERKAAIGKASMENCALQQEEWIECMKNGSWQDQMQMCKHQVRRFERCYSMQSRFLRALGYGSVLGRPPIVDEDIQMHADSLYQRMLQHEAAVEKAKADGTPIPELDLRLPQAKSVVAPTEEVQKQWKEVLDKLPEDERAAEEAALRADLGLKSDLARDVRRLREAAKEEAKKGENQGTMWDVVSSLLGGGKK
ncbi:hypothetical protein S40288_07278 [Stachybotrys chartarum IBT 40288]|nr:hypothetical protein S40288_07278 [Stachybotrys chartarum IBT 40288]